ncbi:hypothetical protein L2E82_28856 [Cichorium intybus]|uniref:Uncharacterized protein n=1 Tax=Cichorium intybus TaxID=13427 RepID=A0ACB9CWW3_CICIN|nr:hypothetical protein L2E82_28856 [Cichorium intybus]
MYSVPGDSGGWLSRTMETAGWTCISSSPLPVSRSGAAAAPSPAILRGLIDFTREPSTTVSEGAKSLIRQMLEPDPKLRLTAKQVGSIEVKKKKNGGDMVDRSNSEEGGQQLCDSCVGVCHKQSGIAMTKPTKSLNTRIIWTTCSRVYKRFTLPGPVIMACWCRMGDMSKALICVL